MKRLLIATVGAVLCAAFSPAFAATWTVTATDSGGACTADSTTDADCTLDAAITAAGSGDLIQFDASIQGQTITLATQTLSLSLTIDGSPGGVALDGAGNHPLFDVGLNATVRFSHLTFQNGHAPTNASGGAIYNSGATTLDSCTVAHNSADLYGGGIYNEGSLSLYNSTIADNSAHSGGGIFNNNALTLGNSTVAANTAAVLGGGIYLTQGTTNLLSNIVATNTAGSGPDIYATPNNLLYSLGSNLIGNGTNDNLTPLGSDLVGTSASPKNPKFAAGGLANNGGATQTMALLGASPAFKTGDCSGNAIPLIPGQNTDQRGLTRATQCTMGAFDLNEIFSDGFEG